MTKKSPAKNWPSKKEGKPSGKRRDNNEPKAPAPKIPAPKTTKKK